MIKGIVTALLLTGVFAFAKTVTAVTVDQMTCKQANRYTIRYRYYFKHSGAETLKISVIPMPKVPGDFICDRISARSVFVEKTADIQLCMVGYDCVPR